MHSDPSLAKNEAIPPLSPEELAVWQDRRFMPLKQQVWAKLEYLLGNLRRELQLLPQPEWLPQELFEASGKISKGENYQSYAYRVLDYPSVFKGPTVFTFRTVLLWGHPIGTHLILSGDYREQFMARVQQNAHRASPGLYLAAQTTPWQWEADAEGLYPLQAMSEQRFQGLLQQRNFLKLSRFLPETAYQDLMAFGISSWEEMSQLLLHES